MTQTQWNPAQPPHQPPRRRGVRGGVLAVVAAVVVLAVGVIAGVIFGTHSSEDERPSGGADTGTAYSEIGDCIKNLDRTPSLAEPVDCSAPDATYVIGKRLPGSSNRNCPSQYDMYVQEGTDGDFVDCLLLNGSAGDCFDGFTPKELKSKIPCAGADVAVVAAFDGPADGDACPARSERRLDYPDPAPGRTLCLAASAPPTPEAPKAPPTPPTPPTP